MKQVITLFVLLINTMLWADIPYTPIRIFVSAHKSVVMEGETIGFTIKVFNSHPTATIPVLHPASQTAGQKLVYFNLYKHQNVNGMWIETESRQMGNAMVHDIPHYPEIVYLKAHDTLSFDVFFNGSFMETSAHHSFQTPLFAGFYKFQAYYNPFGTVSGDTLYNFYDDFKSINPDPGKVVFQSSGEVYYPINITILKNPNAEFNIGNNHYFCEKLTDSTYNYYDENKVLIEKRVLAPELISSLPIDPKQGGSQKTPLQINLFPIRTICEEHCNICYAIKHREEDYLEVLIRRYVRKHRNDENGLTDLKSFLLGHQSIAFVNYAGLMLSSLPSSAYLYVGLNSGYDIKTYGLGLQIGKVGKIPYYSFKNRSIQRSSKVDYMKMKYFEFDLRPVQTQLKIDEENFAAVLNIPPHIPEIWPGMDYIFALSNSRPELGVLSLGELKANAEHQPERFKKEYLESKDPISWCFAAAAGSIYDRTDALRLIREKHAIEALPYLFKCAQILANYEITDTRDGFSEELFMFELKKTIEKLTGSTIYLPGNQQYKVQDYLKVGIQQWNSLFYSVSNLSDGTYVVEIREGSVLE